VRARGSQPHTVHTHSRRDQCTLLSLTAPHRVRCRWAAISGGDGLSSSRRERACAGVHVLLVTAQLLAILGTFFLPAFRRQIVGTVGDAARVIGGLDVDRDVTFLEVGSHGSHSAVALCTPWRVASSP
jgi:hypothetical protein